MSVNSTTPNLLADVFVPGRENSLVKNVLLAIAGSLILWACAKIQVPFYPVPVTMTTFAVLMIAMVYGWKLGTATILLYLAEGAAGLPVFAGTPEKGIGIAYMMGGTGGYLIGYVFAVALCGWLAERNWDKNVVTTAIAMLLGNIVLYIPGLLWLGILFGWDKPILEWGLIPFIPGDLLKLALAAVTLPLIWRIVRKN